MYNLTNINIYKTKDGIIIKTPDKKYYFNKIYNEKRVLEIDKVLKNNTEHYKIIKNIYGQVSTEYHQDKYVLLEENTNYTIASKDIILNVDEYKNYSINQSDWITLWSKKIDYYEKHIPENKYLIESKDYYIGMSENAIQYLKYHDIRTKELVINNLMVTSPLNTLGVVLDCKERKTAELIKYYFFIEEKDTLDILKEVENVFTTQNKHKIFARLLFPNYYFNIYDEFILGQENEEKLKKIISKTNKYEELLNYIVNKYNIDIPTWIKKD